MYICVYMNIISTNIHTYVCMCICMRVYVCRRYIYTSPITWLDALGHILLNEFVSYLH